MSVKADDVRDMNLVAYLKSLGIVPARPARQGDRNLWYLSPLHPEKTPSFRVDTKTNWWIDYGMAPEPGSKHKFLCGRIIEFGKAYFNCDLPTFLSMLTVGDFPIHKAPVYSKDEDTYQPQITVTKERSLIHPALLKYVMNRRIPIEVADRFCVEVDYTMNNRDFFAIGFKNDAGGYEIRNKHYKLSSMPKEIRTIDNGSSRCVLLEGGFELLTFATIHGLDVVKDLNFCVLNGAAMFNRALPFLKKHEEVLMYFNTDATGLKYRDIALEMNDKKNPKYDPDCPEFTDQSALYSPCNDLNEWFCSYGQGRQPRSRLSI